MDGREDPAGSALSPQGPARGARLGPYRIEAEVGAGGMGRVYRAVVTDRAPGIAEGTVVALKVVHPHLLETPGFFKRFLREAEVGKRVVHANVVRTLDCDAVGGAHFLVMEYVEGQTLRALLHDLERVPEELCRHVGREVARGLAAIHAAGVVHRDLKPENVLITPEHAVKVMDLGVAGLRDEAIRLSQTGAFLGSLEYAAPEQFRGGETDGRTDLHALGVILYELATGRNPFHDEDARAVLRHVLETTPRKAGDVNPQVSPFFEEVVATLLAKDPRERFADAPTLAQVLEEGEKGAWWQARAKALRLETRRPLRRIRIPRETALYGRDDDLARLRALYDRAKAGEGRVLLLGGEAGIGKTRLVDEFVGRLRQEGEDLHFLFGSCPPGGAATASGAFTMAYREQFGPEGSRAYLPQTPLLVPAFDALLRGDATPTGAEPLTKDSLQTVFVHATRALAAERPTIVLIDDLHFAPEEGRALFASLAMAVPGHRVLLIGTMRPGVAEEWTSGITRLEQAEQRTLARLGPKDLTRLLIDAFRSERLAEELAFRIAQKSDGNPFFAFEIIRGLREGQFIAQRPDGSWVTTRAIHDIQVPSSVLDLVNARVADLTEDERNLLDVASCCGFEFDSRVVAEALAVPRIPVLQRLARIEKKHRLVRSAGDRFQFDHHQVQEALYGALPKPLREEYHAAIAGALEVAAGAADRDPNALDGALSTVLCSHFLAGARGPRALRYLGAALDHLQRGFLFEQAAGLARTALDLPGLLGGKERLRVLVHLNDALDVLGRATAQRAVLTEARALAEATQAGWHRAWADLEMGGLLVRGGRPEEGRAHLERSAGLFRALGDRRSEGTATMATGNACRNLGRRVEARAHYDQALAIAREVGDLATEGSATLGLGNLCLELGRPEEARAHYERALALARAVPDRRLEAVIRMNVGNAISTGGRHEAALEWFSTALGLARELGDRRSEGLAALNLGAPLARLGDLVGSHEQFERALAIAREVGGRRNMAIAMLNLAATADDRGQREQAVALATEALALAREADLRNGDVLLEAGRILWRGGEGERARRTLLQAVDALRGRTGDGALALAHALLARMPGGDPRPAEEALEGVREGEDLAAARYHLWKATGRREHLAEAKRLSDRILALNPGHRESMLANALVHREIAAAAREAGL